MKHWGERLVSAMKARGWDYPDLARESGVSVESLRKYGQCAVDNPRGDNMARIANALEVDLVWLRDGTSTAEGEPLGDLPADNLEAAALLAEHVASTWTKPMDPKAKARLYREFYDILARYRP